MKKFLKQYTFEPDQEHKSFKEGRWIRYKATSLHTMRDLPFFGILQESNRNIEINYFVIVNYVNV